MSNPWRPRPTARDDRADISVPTALPLAVKMATGAMPASRWLTFAATLSVCAVMSRGLMQLYVTKQTAYMFSVVPLIALLAGLSIFKAGRGPMASTGLLILAANICIAVASTFLTISRTVDLIAVIYLPFYLVTPALMLWGLMIRNESEARISWGIVVLATGWYLSLLGMAQSLGVIDLPGFWYYQGETRLSGPVGSKQHYSIAIAILSVITLHLALVRHRAIYYGSTVVFAMMTILSLTRSGIAILVLGVGGSLVSMPSQMRRRLLLASALCAIGLTGFVYGSESGAIYIDRVLSISDMEGTGNGVRLATYASTFQEWLGTNLLLGEHFGEYSQVSSNLFNEAITISESSVMMTLLHTGFLGLVVYYLPFIALARVLWNDARTLAVLTLACAVQSAVYMSVEALPYVVLVSLLPLIGRHSAAHADATLPAFYTGSRFIRPIVRLRPLVIDEAAWARGTSSGRQP